MVFCKLINLMMKIMGFSFAKQSKDKLDPRALRCVFLRYSSNKNGYKCYHPPTKRSFITIDVTFFESQPYFTHTYL